MSASPTQLDAARSPHKGVFITGADRLELLEDSLPDDAFAADQILLEALGNCRCSSDKKAIHQFHKHARIPGDAEQVALGHECIQRVVSAPPGSPVSDGDLVLVTPGHFATPHNPATFEPDPDHGVLGSLGYSYRYLGGLRQFSAIPVRVIDVVREQGFGALFNRVPLDTTASLATLAHAEPFACCFGTMKHMFWENEDGDFSYGIPPRARIAFLGGTARMAMIKLTILAARSDDELPTRIAITGSQAKLDALAEYPLIQGLESRGVDINLIDRRDDDIVSELTRGGKYEAVFTNFPSQEVFDQAVAIIEAGGNLNNYAGAVDPDIAFSMTIPGVPGHESPVEEARSQIDAMHHNVAPNDPGRVRGIAKDGRVALIGFASNTERLNAYLGAFPAGTTVHVEGAGHERLAERFSDLEFVAERPATVTDVFIAGNGPAAAEAYTEIETSLARSAAVNFVDGCTTISIRSKHIHYTSRHQICGPTVPYSMTNTSEPISGDMALQGANPIDFDWLVKGVSGLDQAVEMIQDVTDREPFGSFFVLPQLPSFPYVEVTAAAFKRKARALAKAEGDERPIRALEAATKILASNGDQWSREVEEAIYAAYEVPYPIGPGA